MSSVKSTRTHTLRTLKASIDRKISRRRPHRFLSLSTKNNFYGWLRNIYGVICLAKGKEKVTYPYYRHKLLVSRTKRSSQAAQVWASHDLWSLISASFSSSLSTLFDIFVCFLYTFLFSLYSLVHWLGCTGMLSFASNWKASQDKQNFGARVSFVRAKLAACQWKLRDFRCGNFSCLFSLLSHSPARFSHWHTQTFFYFASFSHSSFTNFMLFNFFFLLLLADFDSIAALNR